MAEGARFQENRNIIVSGPILPNAISIPKSSILQTQQGAMVIVVDAHNKAMSRQIKILLNEEDNAIVESGLKTGERIIIEGIGKIKDGQTVKEAEY